MKLTLTHRGRLVDACFVLAVLVWIASLSMVTSSISYMIAPFAIPLFVVGLAGHFTWRRAVLAAMGIGWATWMLWVGLG